MRRAVVASFQIGLGLALTAILGAPARGAGPREHVRFASGATPGGLVWAVSMKTGRIVLRATDGTPRGSYPLAPDERFVLGVADDGTRISARRPWGLLPVDDPAGTPRTQSARLDFRGPSGELLARRTVTSLYGSAPAILGAEAHLVRRDGKRLTLVRVSATEAEAPVATIPLEPLVKDLGTRFEARLFSSAAGLVLQLEGGGRTAYLLPAGKPRTILVDPSLACGWSGYQSAHPNGARGVSRIGSRAAPSGSRTASIAVLETLDADGHLVRVFPLGPQAPLTPLEGGELLAIRPGELVRFDDRGNEVSRVPFSLDPDRSGSEALGDALRRLRTRGAEATGRDWAELALLPDAPLYEFRDVLARDVRGALARLGEVPDGAGSIAEARTALRWALNAGASRSGAGGGAGTDPLGIAIGMVESGGPAWLRRAVAFPALTTLRDHAPAWTLPSIAEAAVRGEGGDEALALPAAQLTPELSELIVALDRSRMDRLDRDAPPLRGPLLLAELPEPDQGRFHLPPGPATAGLVDCFAGAGPIRFQAALEALAGPAMEDGSRRAAERRGRAAVTEETADPSETTSRIVVRLVAARHAGDPAVRAGALLLSPFYGIPIDAERFRQDVLSRPDSPLLAAGALTFDTSLPSEPWKRLFGESLAAARAQSPDPGACTRASDGDRDEDDFDPYCVFVEGILRFAQSPPDADGDDLAPRRAAEIGDWSRSGSAPPELRAQALIARILEGNAPDDELSAAWRDSSRPFSFRRMALQARLAHLPAGAAEEWRRELRGGRGSSREEAALIGALALVDRSEAARLAADGVRAGKLEAPRAEAAEWLDALDPATVAGDARLRDTLRARLGDEEIGPEVAALLGRAGDREAFPHVATALGTGCLRCLGKETLLSILEPFGADGRDLLETLGRTAEAESAATALDALFEVDPTRAASAAEERLAASLSADCVPQGLLRLLVRRELDPFPAVAARLAALDCRRDGLRPAGTLRVDDDPDADSSRVKGAAARLFPPACREAFESLFGIGERERER